MGPVVVTGGAGFLGWEIGKQLGAKNAPTLLLDQRCESLTPQSLPPRARVVQADITRSENLIEVFLGAYAVIHAAGLAHVFDRSGAMDSAFWKVNADGTENVARIAAKAGVCHFVLISSTSVYGPREGVANEDSPLHPVGAYGESKLEAESRARRIARESGMALTILRPVTMYGEGDKGNVLRLIRAVDRRRFAWIGSGTNRKSLLHRDDVAEACVLALNRDPTEELILNVAGPSFEMREIIATISSELRRGVLPLHVPAGPLIGMARVLTRTGPGFAGGRNGLLDSLRKWVQDDVYDGTKIQQRLGWQPRVSLREGLRREVRWYLASTKGKGHS